MPFTRLIDTIKIVEVVIDVITQEQSTLIANTSFETDNDMRERPYGGMVKSIISLSGVTTIGIGTCFKQETATMMKSGDGMKRDELKKIGATKTS